MGSSAQMALFFSGRNCCWLLFKCTLKNTCINDKRSLFAGSVCPCLSMWCTHGWTAPTWRCWRNSRRSKSKWKRNRELWGSCCGFQWSLYYLAEKVVPDYIVTAVLKRAQVLLTFHLSSSELAYKPRALALSFAAIGSFSMRPKVTGDHFCESLVLKVKWKVKMVHLFLRLVSNEQYSVLILCLFMLFLIKLLFSCCI